MKKISSVHNEEIKAIVKLHTVKGRKEQKRFFAEGYTVCATLIAAGYKPLQVYSTELLLPQAQQLAGVRFITVVDSIVLAKMSAAQTPSGILSVFSLPSMPEPALLSAGIVLYNVTDPGNMGTLLRTCAAMGKKTAVIIEGADPWSPKVVQASAGTLGLLDIFELSWPLLKMHQRDLQLHALVCKGGKTIDKKTQDNILFLVGNEAQGIPEHIVQECDQQITLEMPGKIDSLNVAVAGSIALYLAWYTSS